jgi:hypothetical protein
MSNNRPDVFIRRSTSYYNNGGNLNNNNNNGGGGGINERAGASLPAAGF